MSSSRTVSRNYLRVRGEYISNPCHSTTVMELPPRARRIRMDQLGKSVGSGTTSACAENTAHTHRRNVSAGNYLRVRGEYHALSRFLGCSRELPPRARRIHVFHFLAVSTAGTTSACAENTVGCWGYQEFHGNYLRVRGEYICANLFIQLFWELPPRARRILLAVLKRTRTEGTTSACAENTGYLRAVWR